MKKFIYVILTMVFISVMTIKSYADNTATYCFDNPAGLSGWEFYGSAAETGFSIYITDDKKESGLGSLAISESVNGDIAEKFGGAFITADKVGLDSFAGCTIQLSYIFADNADDATDNFSIYSDGIVWIQTVLPYWENGWALASLTIPETAANTKFGFTIPTFSQYNGTAVYIDNLYIYDKDGNLAANVGDFQVASEQISVKTTDESTNRILTVTIPVVIILAIVIIICLIFMRIKRFR